MEHKNLDRYIRVLAKKLDQHWKAWVRNNTRSNRIAYVGTSHALFALLRIPTSNPQIVIGLCHAGALVERLKDEARTTRDAAEQQHFAPLFVYAIHYSGAPL